VYIAGAVKILSQPTDLLILLRTRSFCEYTILPDRSTVWKSAGVTISDLSPAGDVHDPGSKFASDMAIDHKYVKFSLDNTGQCFAVCRSMSGARTACCRA
jgi:hypothetical protein